jgi:uncharacterized LabA/DUF88 family protein
MKIAKDVDSVILLSGDGDFGLLLEQIRNDFGVSTQVYGVPTLTAKNLINSSDIFHPITEELAL